MNFIGQILPVDGYYVLLKDQLTADYTTSLTHLYQPLIGMQAVMLYQTLLHELEFQKDSPQTHHTLMNYLNIPLDELYKARLNLEGIGLLKTYKKQLEQSTMFTYEIQCPFSPNDFFHDAMLSQLLYHQLGHEKFSMLKNRYKVTTHGDLGENITASFNDVFQTFTPTLEVVKPISSNDLNNDTTNSVDLHWMEQMLKQRMIPVGQVLTPDNRKLISQMMELYDLDNYEIEKSILWALNEENLLDCDEFKNACHDLFKSKHNNATIKLTERITFPKQKEQTEPKTKEEMLIQKLETISPKQLLEDLSGGHQASEQDMKIIRDVMTSQGLPSPVMNVLIHYVLLQSDMKLSKAYLEKIASHWSRAKIKTAKEAMEFAKKERDKFQKTNNKKQNYNYTKRNTKEIIPDWFKERKGNRKESQTENPPINSKQPIVNLEEEKAKLHALLNQKQKNN
ncbi:chromosome replication initiation protein [Bacilli bacterium]|uniref:replication initiation and membrane attachment family protein n=1 Tax=Oceanobacillus TaxID=182709 RepID=UPI0006210177|nr:DnaD domain protein [Oceanobacillus caeni]KKE79032.1 chromosome replication initiation protein [Bacilli bacterium VT-13-104]PZD86277.1 chromosome replication initiation protein [Bacilli bacterium]MBU8789610.1 DnaD domain protein [Oceanobacillus caeni]PZD87124.1 chromosome replication initiation protein [Bacilli bacterium]PZD90351.1 chromosome replication initiation protein [Bacilli bacterium]